MKSFFKKTNNVLDKWEPTGLLEGLNDNDKISVAMILEEAARWLIYHNYNETDNSLICYGVIVMGRRLFDRCQNVRLPSFHKVVELLEYYDEITPDVAYYAIDREAEIISIVTDRMVHNIAIENLARLTKLLA